MAKSTPRPQESTVSVNWLNSQDHFFSWRNQTLIDFSEEGAQATIHVAYEAVLAADLPNGMHAGETLKLTGRSEFTFRDGMIIEISDTS